MKTEKRRVNLQPLLPADSNYDALLELMHGPSGKRPLCVPFAMFLLFRFADDVDAAREEFAYIEMLYRRRYDEEVSQISSKYRSAKSVVLKAISLGVPLCDSKGVPRTKGAVLAENKRRCSPATPRQRTRGKSKSNMDRWHAHVSQPTIHCLRVFQELHRVVECCYSSEIVAIHHPGVSSSAEG